jgi:hypothetical protein
MLWPTIWLTDMDPYGLIQGDPLARLIVGRLRLAPLAASALALVITAVYALLLPDVFGALVFQPSVQARLADIPALGIFLLIGPGVWFYYAWQLGALERSFQELAQSAEVPAGMAAAVEALRPRHLQKWGAPVAAAIATALVVASPLALQPVMGGTWLTYNWARIGLLQIVSWPTLYMAAIVLNRQFHSAAAMSRLLAKRPLKVATLHPDRAGGLGRLGRHILVPLNTLPIAGLYLGLVIVRAGSLESIPHNLALLPVLTFLAATLILCLWPLWRAHRLMAAAKRQLLAELAGLFEAEYGQIVTRLHTDILPPRSALRLRAHEKLYRIGEAMPEWPLDFGLFSRLVVTIVVPVLIPLAINLVLFRLIR